MPVSVEKPLEGFPSPHVSAAVSSPFCNRVRLSLLQIMTERKNAKAMAGSLQDRMQAGLDLPLQGGQPITALLSSLDAVEKLAGLTGL